MHSWIDIAGDLEGTGRFLRLVEKTGYAKILAELGPFTVLIPHDQSLRGMGEDEWHSARAIDFINHHILPTRQFAQQIAERSSVVSLAGSPYRVRKDKRFQVGNAGFLDVDAACGDTVVHVIDQPLAALARAGRPRPTAPPENPGKPRISKAKWVNERYAVGTVYHTLDDTVIEVTKPDEWPSGRPQSRMSAKPAWIETW